MNARFTVSVFFVLALVFSKVNGQVIIHEVGVLVGPAAFYSDFGERNDFETNSNNTGIGFGIFYTMNFSDSDRPRYFDEHFKLRAELSYHKTKLNFYGRYVAEDKTSFFSDQLRATEGVSQVIEFGPQLEYYFLNIRDYMFGQQKLSPYVSLGLHYVNFNPQITSSISPPLNTHPKYIGSFQQVSGSTASVVGSVGLRFRLNEESDVFLDSRWTYYFSDWVDGLNPSLENNGGARDVPENRANDWRYWLNVGYVYYLN